MTTRSRPVVQETLKPGSPEREELLKLVGDPKQIDRDLREFHKSMRVVFCDATLVDRYPEEWVAAYRGRLVGHAKTLEGLLKQLDSSGIPRGQAAINHLTRDNRPMIL